jgi:hypothetical protein
MIYSPLEVYLLKKLQPPPSHSWWSSGGRPRILDKQQLQEVINTQLKDESGHGAATKSLLIKAKEEQIKAAGFIPMDITVSRNTVLRYWSRACCFLQTAAL